MPFADEENPYHQCLDCGISFLSLRTWMDHFQIVHDNDQCFAKRNVVVHYKSVFENTSDILDLAPMVNIIRAPWIENALGCTRINNLIDTTYPFFIDKETVPSTSEVTTAPIIMNVDGSLDSEDIPQLKRHGDPDYPSLLRAALTSVIRDEVGSRSRKVATCEEAYDDEQTNFADNLENYQTTHEVSEPPASKIMTTPTRTTRRRTRSRPRGIAIRKKGKRMKTRQDKSVLKSSYFKTRSCNLCEEIFRRKSDLLSHILNCHDGNGLLKCNVCSKEFLTEFSLNVHLRVHSDENPFKCRFCDESFSSISDMKNHVKTHTKIYKCSLCEKSFNSRQSLKEHMPSHKGEKRHQCRVCAKRFSANWHLTNHMRLHTRENMHVCEKCGKCFNIAKTLTQHISSVHSEGKRYECKICLRKFSVSMYLKKHMWVHLEHKPHKCSVCDKAFSHAHKLRYHELTHTAKSHQCYICGKCFTQTSHLNRHVKSVHEGRPGDDSSKYHKCNVCPKLFKEVEKLREHMECHAEDRPHQCDECFRRFKRPAMLKNHELFHLGTTPCTCSVCNKRFPRRIDLDKHMVQEHNIYRHQCTYCPKGFLDKPGLQNHLRIHTGEKPFQCSLCGKCFNQNSHMKRHVKLMHPDNSI